MRTTASALSGAFATSLHRRMRVPRSYRNHAGLQLGDGIICCNMNHPAGLQSRLSREAKHRGRPRLAASERPASASSERPWGPHWHDGMQTHCGQRGYGQIQYEQEPCLCRAGDNIRGRGCRQTRGSTRFCSLGRRHRLVGGFRRQHGPRGLVARRRARELRSPARVLHSSISCVWSRGGFHPREASRAP